MPPKPGKHTPFFELVDAQALSGCPVCRLIYKATDRYLDSILYEAVLDPDVRAKLKRSRGFCAEHVEMLRNRPGRALGIALIYRDIIKSFAQTLASEHFVAENALRVRFLGQKPGGAKVTAHLAADHPCPACLIGQEAEKNILEILLAHLEDERLATAYAEGEGLCLPHLMRALDAAPDGETFRRLVEPQAERYKRMLTDLDEFIRKRDYRFRHEEYGEEGDVWLRAMNVVVGGAGLGLGAKSGGRRSEDLVDMHR